MDIKQHFTKVIKENEGLIFKITTLYTNSIQDRKDLYQEILYQLWKSFTSFNEQSKLSTWMYRVSLNTAIYHLKQTKRRINTIPIDLETQLFSDDRDKEEEENKVALSTYTITKPAGKRNYNFVPGRKKS